MNCIGIQEITLKPWWCLFGYQSFIPHFEMFDNDLKNIFSIRSKYLNFFLLTIMKGFLFLYSIYNIYHRIRILKQKLKSFAFTFTLIWSKNITLLINRNNLRMWQCVVISNYFSCCTVISVAIQLKDMKQVDCILIFMLCQLVYRDFLLFPKFPISFGNSSKVITACHLNIMCGNGAFSI